jgi:hypothetical protein
MEITIMKYLLNISHKKTFITLLCLCSSQLVNANELFTLKNLERERATLISDFLSTSLDSEQKQQRLQQTQRQLADMERMVLRDERLLSAKSTMVDNAFKEYDKTFLVHAGAEQQMSAMNKWLKNVNLTNESVLNARAGYR